MSNDLIKKEVNIFELGGWALPLIISNAIFLTLYFFYRKNKLTIFKKQINFINKNDISKRISSIIILILIVIYIIFSIDEFQREEFEFGDYAGVEKAAKDYNFEASKIFSSHIKYLFLNISYVLFDNLRILPFLASISLLLVTYFLTLEITKKRFAAIISFTVLLQSNLFLLFDTTSTYENSWTLFYFISLYLIFKKPIGSHIAFILSIMSKALVITLLPINLFAISINGISKRNKIFLLVGYCVLISLILIAIATNNLAHSEKMDFDINRFIESMNEFGNSMRYESLILVMFIPTLLLLKSKTKLIRDKINFIFIAISFAIISQPIMNVVIDMTLQPYRFIPLIVFSAISIGMIFSKTNTLDQQ